MKQEQYAKDFFIGELGREVLQYIERNNKKVSYDYVDKDGGKVFIIRIGDDSVTYHVKTKKWDCGISYLDNLKFNSFEKLVEYTLSTRYKNYIRYINSVGINIDFESYEDYKVIRK
jgi:hypothetical protein